jgi:sugar phosphate permease
VIVPRTLAGRAAGNAGGASYVGESRATLGAALRR